MRIYERQILDLNRGKKVTFVNGMGELTTGFIQNLGEHFGNMNWEISKTRNPKTKLDITSGNWFIVDPLRIVQMEKLND